MAKNVADVAAGASRKNQAAAGLHFERHFTPPGAHAYDLVEWDRRTAAITGEKGQAIF